MTNKEQIIIDGTECKNYNNGSCQEGDYPVPLANIISCDPQNIRCDFYIDRIEEQLSGKAQECEELKEKLSAANLEIGNLKKELDKAYEWEQTNRATGICETCTEKANLILDNYRKAFKVIKEFCSMYSDNHDVYETICKCILDIINEAEDCV